jgi:hypothetical protein
MNSTTNCGPLSERAFPGSLWCFQMCWTYSFAVPAAERVVMVSIK